MGRGRGGTGLGNVRAPLRVLGGLEQTSEAGGGRLGRGGLLGLVPPGEPLPDRALVTLLWRLRCLAHGIEALPGDALKRPLDSRATDAVRLAVGGRLAEPVQQARERTAADR